jgi:regulator of sirC expression with transglutaminase-like and TPR domain
VSLEPFADLAAQPDPPLDRLALALASEFRELDANAAIAELDRLGSELAAVAGEGPRGEAAALRELLGERHGFSGDRDDYDNPDNSMLDVVLERRKGLPILLSIVYVEVARRVGAELAGVGLPGHFVVGHFGQVPALLLDPFAGGAELASEAPIPVRPWGSHETALRMLNNLVASYLRRHDLSGAIRAAEMRLALSLAESDAEPLAAELRSLRARLN